MSKNSKQLLLFTAKVFIDHKVSDPVISHQKSKLQKTETDNRITRMLILLYVLQNPLIISEFLFQKKKLLVLVNFYTSTFLKTII